MRKTFLQKLHRFFGGSNEIIMHKGWIKLRMHKCSSLHPCTSFFPLFKGHLVKLLRSGNHTWLSDSLKSSSDYCVRSFLSRSARIQTAVLIPIDSGVIELGSVRSIPENKKILQLIRCMFTSNSAIRKKDENGSHSNFAFRERQEEYPKFFGHDLNLGRFQIIDKPIVEKVEESPWDVYQNGNGVSFQNNRKAPGMKPGTATNSYSSQTPVNNQQKLGNSILVMEDHQLNQIQSQKKQLPKHIDFSVGATSKGSLITRPVELEPADADEQSGPADEQRPRKSDRWI
ncbi:hypothetical protein MKX01_010827 [Papaver californicum]|nr:hypothetical protein MKX01_010827 [Papaver californicum]